MRYTKMLVVLALFAPGLAACATQQAMTVASGAVANPSPKYRNAIAVRSVSGGQVMNILTVPGVANEPLKAALEGTLAANGYLAQSGTPKFYLDAEIRNLDQPLIGLSGGNGGRYLQGFRRRCRRGLSHQDQRQRDILRLADCRRPHAHRQRARDAQNIEQFLQALR